MSNLAVNNLQNLSGVAYLTTDANGNVTLPKNLTVTGTATLSLDAGSISTGILGSGRLPSIGNITNAGAIGSTANLPVITTTGGVLTTGAFGTTSGTFCAGDDSRVTGAMPTSGGTFTGTVTASKNAVASISALADGASITPDLSAACNFSVTLGGNRQLANPTNITAGQSGSIFITQDGTGSRTLSYGGYWKFAGGSAPTLTTTASAVDRLDYIVVSSTVIHAVLTKAYA